MEFFAQKSDLLKELDLIQSVVEKKNTIPILSNVLLEFENFQLRLSATDLELGARCTCPAKVKTAGAVTVPGRRLLEIVRSLSDAEIRFRVLENNWLQVTCERSSFKLVGLAKDNFPILPGVPKSRARVAASVLKNLIDRWRVIMGNPDSGWMFGSGPLDADNFDNRHIMPFVDNWHGWHAFRRGLSTTLHRLGAPDKDIQQILRHANINVTQESYIKTTTSDALNAMRLLERVVNLPHITEEGKKQ